MMAPAYMTTTRRHRDANDAEVVTDQQQGQPQPRHQAGDQRKHLALHRHVERGGGFVRHQQARVAGQRLSDQHALAHATGEFVRIAGQQRAGVAKLHRFQQFDAAFREAPALAVGAQHVGHLLADGEDRIRGTSPGPGIPCRSRRRAGAAALWLACAARPRRRSGCCRKRCALAVRDSNAAGCARAPTCRSRSRRRCRPLRLPPPKDRCR